MGFLTSAINVRHGSKMMMNPFKTDMMSWTGSMTLCKKSSTKKKKSVITWIETTMTYKRKTMKRKKGIMI